MFVGLIGEAPDMFPRTTDGCLWWNWAVSWRVRSKSVNGGKTSLEQARQQG